jgi:DNA polymerase III subunit chi
VQVDFYHLTAVPLERVLPRICERVLEGGGRLLVISGEESQREAVDRLLWSYAPEGFLPHAQAGVGDDTLQPVLIAAEPAVLNSARNVALIDGVWRDEALRFERTFHFFDEASLVAARAAWKALAGRDGVERRYWKQDDGGGWIQAG